MDSFTMYDTEYFEYLKKRSQLQKWIRYYFFAPLHPYLKGVVLDLGCGIGEVSEHVQNKDKYLGIDVNPYCIKYLQQKSLKAKIGSAYEIPTEDASVDVVVISHVLEHLENPAKAASEISRVLRPLGYLIVIVPTIKGFRMDSTHQIFYDRKKLKEFANNYQYTPLSITTFPFNFELLGKLFYFFEYRMIAQKNETQNLNEAR